MSLITAQSSEVSQTRLKTSATEQAAMAKQKMDSALQYSKAGKHIAAIEIYNELLQKYPAVLNADSKLKALVYIELSFSHSSLGNQKEEIDFVEIAIEIMESDFTKINEIDYLTAYNNLHYYYGEYDDNPGIQATYVKFAKYFSSRFKKAVSTPEYFYARRILRKMEVSSALIADDPQKAKAIVKQFRNEIQHTPSKEREADNAYLLANYSSICDYYNYSSKEHEAGLQIANDFLQTSRTLKDSFNIMLAHSKLANQYREQGNYQNALFHVEASLQSFHFPPTSLSRFSLETMKAMNMASLQNIESAISLVEGNIVSLLNTHIGPGQTIMSFNNQKMLQLNNSRYINIFASSALIFKEAYLQKKTHLYLTKTEKLVETAALLFGEYYKKGSYNLTLQNLQKKIVEAYLFVAIEKYSNNLQAKKKIIDNIERNNSFHLAKAFESQLLKNETALANLMNQLNWEQQQKEYWTQVQIENGGSKEYSTKIQSHINAIKKLTQEINIQKKPFADLTLSNYSLESCIQILTNDKQILKFYVASQQVYQVLISKNDIQIKQIANAADLSTQVNAYNEQVKKPLGNWKSLSSKLYQLLVSNVKANQLTIIPDNYLNYLSFESLYDATTQSFFVDKKQISYNYSLSLWYLHQKLKLQQSPQKLAAFAPIYNQVSYNNTAITDLPFARKEAQAIAQVFKGETYLGSAATKEKFYSVKDRATLLHCSMHAIVYDDNFNNSCLLFNNAKPLYLKELYATAMPLDLIVLSACNTGAGKLVEGEGLMSMSRAFTYAGVKSTVVSLWQVPDKETSQIMLLFYKYLNKGYGKDGALAEAKRKFIEENPLQSHPYFWSGFILTGNEAAISQSFLEKYYLLILLSVCFIILLFFVKRKLRK